MRSMLTLILILAVGAASAQQQKKQQLSGTELQPSILSQLFPRLTGLNGYEELIMAADLVRDNRALEAAQQDGATLAAMRRALANKDLQRALQLLREGLNKPIASPRDLETVDENTLLPELGQFRTLARLLKIQQYVLLSEGRVGPAIDTMWDGLRLGYAIQQESLVSGLVGVAIDSLVLDGLAQHLDQLSVGDCERLIHLTQDWLKTPSPLRHVVENEHNFNLRALRKMHDDSDRLLNLIESGGQTDDPDTLTLLHYISDHPTSVGTMVDQTTSRFNTEYNTILANLSLPVWQRKPLEHNPPASMADRLYGFFGADFTRVMERYDTERARVHLLGVHAAIHRFRWEKNRLPSALTALELSDLIQDPFTGKPLVYTLSADRYELYSAGPQSNNTASVSAGPLYLPIKRIK